MSTKNLARTVIEGGRAPRNRWERRRSNALERRWEAQASARLRLALAPEEISYQPRPKVYAELRDRLGPARRWLEAQVGRPWNDVRSALIKRFDTRTTAGCHILYDHILPSVQDHRRRFLPPDFDVDEVGKLVRGRRRERICWMRASLAPPSAQDQIWMAARRVGQRGSACFWFVRTEHGAYRQCQRLSAAEVERFLALPDQLPPAVRRPTAGSHRFAVKAIRDAELFDDNAKPEVISRKRMLPRDVAHLMAQPGSASACSWFPS